MNDNLSRYKFLSGSTLKVIAVISMTIDHMALYAMAGHLGMQDLWSYGVLRSVGRIAFPIFAFLAVEGYRHTRNINKYMRTLLLTAFVSEIPWYLLGQHDSHNVLFTLLLGLLSISITDRLQIQSWKRILPSCFMAAAATAANTDYSWHGIGLMTVFSLFTNKSILIFLFGLPFLLEFGLVGTSCGILICLVYNGKRGFIQGKWQKYIFYMYYPLHLVAIWCLLHLC